MNILNRITTGLSVVIFAACCVAFLLFGMSGTGWKTLTIPTGSMRPGIPPGSLALVHRVPDNTLKVGDVITYTNPLRPSATLSHRIIKKILIGGKIPGFITKGDANKVADVPFVAGAVVGKVVWHISYIGYALLWLKTWTGIAVVVYIPAVLIVVEELLRLNSYYKSLEPYRLFGYMTVPEKELNLRSRKFAFGVSTTIVILTIVGIVAPQVDALFKSNTVSLTKNSITVEATPTNKCSGNANNITSINVTNSSDQSSSTGNASVTGNTSGGNATSGSVTNNNTTTTTISITNC